MPNGRVIVKSCFILIFVGARVGAVDNSSSEYLLSAACPRDPWILHNEKDYCSKIDPTGSRGQAAGRRQLLLFVES